MDNGLNEWQRILVYNLMIIWTSNPELRFSQLVYNLQHEYSNQNGKRLHTSSNNIDTFYLQDKEFAQFLEKFIEDNKEKK